MPKSKNVQPWQSSHAGSTSFANKQGVRGNFAFRIVDPGEHSIIAEMGGAYPNIPSKISLSAETGRKYYVRAELTIENWTTNAVLQTLVPEETAQMDIGSFNLVEWLW